MNTLAARLLGTIRKKELLRAGERVAVAVSGGADSVALLCLLQELRGELGIVLSVAHVNHKLRGAESDRDEKFVRELAAAHSLDFHAVDAPIHNQRLNEGDASRANSGVEAAARELRYNFFGQLARRANLARIATAHTLDDQAETVLLRIFRGTGIRGLAGVHPRFRLRGPGDDESATPAMMSHEESRLDNQSVRTTGGPEVVRPLLGLRRAELRDYLQARGQEWREDSSNEDMKFLRNRVRKHLLPIIADEYGAAAIEHIAELAEIARAEEEWCSKELSKAKLGGLAPLGPSLDVHRLLQSPLAVQRRIVRAWIEANAPEVSISFRLIEQILDLACGQSGKTLQLGRAAVGAEEHPQNAAGDVNLRRRGNELVFEREDGNEPRIYQYKLALPGEVTIKELGMRIEARLVNAGDVLDTEGQALLDPQELGPHLVIRNWKAGDRYWPAHTSAEKKVKELLGDRHATGTVKKLWPVAAAEDGRLVWMRGFAVPEALRPRAERAIWIRETSLSS